MKIRQYPGKATAIGPTGMEFHYEANWQEVNKKWGLEERIKKTESQIITPVKDVSRIGVKLPGLTNRVRQENRDSDNDEKIKPPEPPKKYTPQENNVSLPSEKIVRKTPLSPQVSANGHELKRGLRDMMMEAMEAENPDTKAYRELEQRYEIYTAQSSNGIVLLEKKPPSILKTTEKPTKRGTEIRHNSIKQTTEPVKPTTVNGINNDLAKHRDQRELIRQDTVKSVNSPVRNITKQFNKQDDNRSSGTSQNSFQNDNFSGTGEIPKLPRMLTRTDSYHIVVNKPEKTVIPDPPTSAPPTPPKPRTAVTFINEPPTIIPKAKDTSLDEDVTTTSTSFDYADFRSSNPPSEDSYHSVGKDTIDMTPPSPAVRSIRPIPKDEELSSWGTRRKNLERLNGNHYHDYEDDDDSWTVDSVYSEDSPKKSKSDNTSTREQYSLSKQNAFKRNDKQKVHSSDLLKESFRIGRTNGDKEDKSESELASYLNNYKKTNKSGVVKGKEYQQKPIPFERTTDMFDTFRVHPAKSTEVEPLHTVDHQDSEFIIPRPKLIVPVHTYGIRKRRTGNMLHSSRRGSDADTVISGTSVSDKKHHTSCPGKGIHSSMYTHVFNVYVQFKS